MVNREVTLPLIVDDRGILQVAAVDVARVSARCLTHWSFVRVPVPQHSSALLAPLLPALLPLHYSRIRKE
jgi:hypothetical protein